MPLDSPPAHVAPQPPPHRRLRTFAAFLLLACLTLGAILYGCVWQGTLNLGPARANLSKIDSRDNLNSSSSVCSTDNAHFAGRRIWLIADGHELLLQKVAAALQSELQKDKHIQEIRLADRWQDPGNQNPGPVPDLTIRLRLVSCSESDHLYSRSLKATIDASLSSSLIASRNGYSDNLSPPTIEIDWNAALDHESNSVGDGLGSDRYQLTSKHIAHQFAEALRKDFTQWREDHGELPPLPPPLYPPYHAPEDMRFLDSWHAQLLVTGPGLLAHNHTLWQWQDHRSPEQTLDDLAAQLDPQGFRQVGRSSKGDAVAYIRFQKDAILIFASNDQSTALLFDPASPAAFHLLYDDRTSAEEWAAIWRQLVRDDQWRPVAQFLNRSLPADLHAQYISLLEGLPAKTAAEWLTLAEHYQAAQSPEKAHAALVRAAALAQLDYFDKSPLDSRLKDLAKKLGDEELPNRSPDQSVLRELAIPELPSDGSPLQVSVPLGQPAAVLYRSPKNALYILSAKVAPNPDGTDNHLLSLIVKSPHDFGSMRSTTAGAMTPTGWQGAEETGFNDLHPKIQARQSAPDTFDITFSASSR